MAASGVCDLLLLLLTGGHYTLRGRIEVEDPAYAVRMGVIGRILGGHCSAV